MSEATSLEQVVELGKKLLRRGMEFVKSLEDQQTPADDEVVGKHGVITSAIKLGHTGEVRVEVRGGSEDFLAQAEGFTSAIEINREVLVIRKIAPRIVVVTPLVK